MAYEVLSVAHTVVRQLYCESRQEKCVNMIHTFMQLGVTFTFLYYIVFVHSLVF